MSNYGNCSLHYSSISPWAENLLRHNCQFAPNAVGLQIWCLLLWVFLWFFFLGRGWFIYLALILFCLLLYSHVAWGLVADPRVSIFKGPFFPPSFNVLFIENQETFSRYLSNRTTISHLHGLPWWLNIKKKSACQGRRYRRVAFNSRGQEDAPGGGNGNPLWYSCLGNPMDRATWWATPSMGSQRVGHDLVTQKQQSLLETNDFHSESAFVKVQFVHLSPTKLA